MSHNPQDILDTILDRLKTLASTETVVGDPVKVGDVTILPMIKISIGFAAGGGEGEIKDKNGHGMGGGGGGGASVSPVGFITYDGKQVKFVSVSKGKIDTLIDTVPEVLRKLGIIRKGDGAERECDNGGEKEHAEESDA